MEESKSELLEFNEYGNGELITFDKTSNTSYGQTVLATNECLSRLPTEIYSIWENYIDGKLLPSSSEEVNSLLNLWFEGKTDLISKYGRVCEFSADTPSDYSGLFPSGLQKRRRIDGEF